MSTISVMTQRDQKLAVDVDLQRLCQQERSQQESLSENIFSNMRTLRWKLLFSFRKSDLGRNFCLRF
jgi:hypothetical protein